MGGVSRQAGLLLGFLQVLPITSAQPVEGLEAFLAKWVEAVRQKNPKAYRKLVHPASTECLVGESEEFLLRHIEDRLSVEILKATSVHIMDLQPNALYGAGAIFNYSIEPTNLITFRIGQNSIGIGAIRQKGQWYEVLPCVNYGGMEQLRHQWMLVDRFSTAGQTLPASAKLKILHRSLP